MQQWWDNMYLETRTPNPVDVNYSFIMREDFSGVSSEAPQVDRAARLISGVLEYTTHFAHTPTIKADPSC